MTEIQHALLAWGIFMVLWHIWIRHYFITSKDLDRWQSIIEKFLHR